MRKNSKFCCVEVQDHIGWGWHQCTRPRGHGPDGSYCKQHDPKVVRARQEASRAKHNTEWQKRRVELAGQRFLDVLLQIADGHSDPRALAADAVKDYHNGVERPLLSVEQLDENAFAEAMSALKEHDNDQ